MSDNKQTLPPWEFWQSFWQNANPQAAAAFLPPMTKEDVAKKINELKSVEIWLNFNLQAVQTQLLWLEQQQKMLDAMAPDADP